MGKFTSASSEEAFLIVTNRSNNEEEKYIRITVIPDKIDFSKDLLTGFGSQSLDVKNIYDLNKEGIRSFHLDGNIGYETGFFDNDRKTNPYFSLSMYAERIYLIMDLFSKIELTNSIFTDKNNGSGADVSQENSGPALNRSLLITGGLFVPCLENYFKTKFSQLPSLEFRTGILMTGGYRLQADKDNRSNPNNDAKHFYNVGLRAAFDYNGYISLLYGRHESLHSARFSAEMVFPLFKLSDALDSRVYFFGNGSFSTDRRYDDFFNFGVYIGLPVTSLANTLGPLVNNGSK